MKIDYPRVERLNRSLSGIVTIEATNKTYDTIKLGDIVVGFIGDSHDNEHFKFTPHNEVSAPYPLRNSYQEAMADMFTEIANDMDLAVEFTILVSRKCKDTPPLDNDNTTY